MAFNKKSRILFSLLVLLLIKQGMCTCSGNYSDYDLQYQPGFYGNWRQFHSFQTGYYACGMTVQYDTSPGTDVTGINGFKFHLCSKDQWFPDFSKDVQESGPFGGWQEPHMCSTGYFISAIQGLVEDPTGDQIILNGVSIKCTNPKTNNTEFNQVSNGGYGWWRSWKQSPGKFICGFSARIQDAQGSVFADDTGMNGFLVQLCSM